MIAHLRGTLLSKTPGSCVLECGGVGYEVTLPVPAFTELPEPGGPVSLHIHTQVREDLLALFGFLTLEQKRLFEKLITVSGVGPKLAVIILGGLSPQQTIAAIRGSDHATLTRIPGVGKRLAERLAVELKEKLDDLAALPLATGILRAHGPAGEDVLSALVNLGYARPSAQKALETAAEREPDAAASFDALFRAALRLVR